MNNSDNIPESDQIEEYQQTPMIDINPSIQTLIPNLQMQHYHHHHHHQQQQQQRAGLVFQDLPPQQPPLFPWTGHPDPLLFPSSSSYASLFTRRPSNSLQFTYDGLLSEAMGGGAPFGLQAELNKMSAQEMMDAKALAASKSHSEAERRRRERINNHLAKLRSLLPSTTKTDKASLLAEVIQHVKELRRQTSAIAETSTVPTESDELTVDTTTDGEDGKLIIKASLCCDDRSDLLPDLIKALKSLGLKTLKAEITTLGGRVKNVLFVTHNDQHSIATIEEALRVVMDKSSGGDESTSGNAKRQRTTTIHIS